MKPPPCIQPGQPLNACAARQFEYHVEGLAWLPGAWRGWRLIGNELIAPDRQRITLDRLACLMELERFAGGGVAAVKREA